MKAHRLSISVAVAVMFTPPVLAETRGNEGYVVDSRNNVVTSGAGHCWHTSQWTSSLAVEPCDAVPRAAVVPAAAPPPKPEPTPQQAAPTPAPVPPAPRVVMQQVDLSADTLFAFDEATLQPDGRSTLDDFARQLNAVRVDEILIVGHADRIGSPEYNQKLSERRANAVKEYLASEVGVPGNRVNVEAKGSTEPVTRREDCRARGQEAIDCLAPDRRVRVEVTGTREVVEAPR